MRVADFTGRAWRYVYDSHGDLIYVISPATPSRGKGCVTEYRYSTAEHPTGPLSHNLTDVFDPAGRHYLHNRYGQDVGMEDYNRVVTQRLGHGVFYLRYGAVEADGESNALPEQDRPAMRCWVKERNVHQTLYVYNAAGKLLRKEEPHRPEGGRSTRVVWRFRYNADGNLVASRSPEGVVKHVLTGREHFYRLHGIDPAIPGADDELWRNADLTADARRGFGRVLATVERAQHHAATSFSWSDRWGDIYQADPDDIIVKHTYEPAYGQPLTTSDPRVTTSPDPGATEPAEYHRLLTRYEYGGPAGDESRDLLRVIAPTPTLPDGQPGPPVVTEILERDGRGRVRRSRDAVGTETQLEYFPETAGPRAGHLRRRIVDAGDPAAGRLRLTTELEVDELGRVTATKLPRGVESGDGRFIVRVAYDALDRVVSARGPTPLDSETRTDYEPAGKPSRIEIDWRDPRDDVDRPRETMVRRFRYDEEHQLVKESWGGEDVARHVRIANRYDAAGTLRSTLAANDTSVHYRYDPRDQLVKTIRAFGTSAESAAVVERDGDGRIVATRSGEGRRQVFTLDVFGRTIAAADSLGHVTRTSYDKAGRALVVRRFERRADGSYWLLARSERVHDELGRPIKDIVNRFDDPVAAADLATDHEPAPGPGQALVTQTLFDAAGRVVSVVDPRGEASTVDYDAVGRVVRTTDAVGNRIETAYDAHGNAVRRDRIHVVRDAEGNVLGEEVLTWLGTYDERDRLVTETDGLGNTTQHAYDTLDRRVRTTDALGNVSEVDHDVYGRMISTTERRTADGLGGGERLPPAIVRYEHDRSGNVLARIDALGRRTEYRLDRANRVVEEILPDVARIVTRYDRDDLVTSVRDAHGIVLRHTYDDAGRLTRTIVDDAEVDAGVVVEGDRSIVRSYDGLGRLKLAETPDTLIELRLDSLGRQLHERCRTSLNSGFEVELSRRFDEAGRLTGLTYPGGRELTFEHDAIGRVRRVIHESDGGDYPGSSLGEPRDLATLGHAGARVREIARPNATQTAFRHDAAGRRIEVRHTGSDGVILHVQQLRDAAANPRLRLESAARKAEPAPLDPSVERFGYDAQYQLAARVGASTRPFTDLAPFAPPSPPPAALVPRQPLIDAEIGALLPPAPTAPADRWIYDLAGNRTRTETEAGASDDYQPDARDRYLAIDGTTRTHDRAGNLLSDGRFEYRYDAWHRLCRVIDPSAGDVVRYHHDPLGRRFIEESPGAPALAIAHDGLDRIADYRDSTCVAQYVHIGLDTPLHLANAGSEWWYHTDLQRSVRALTDEAGTVAASYRFDLFGNLLDETGPALAPPVLDLAAQPFGFGARPYDPSTALYDQRARSYDPATGRFLQRDPAGPVDGTNLYTYATNHPLAFTDPTGLASRDDLDRGMHDRVLDRMDAEPQYQSPDAFEGAFLTATGIIKRASLYSPTGVLFQWEYAKGFIEAAGPIIQDHALQTARRAISVPGAIAWEAYKNIQALRQAPAAAAGLVGAVGNAFSHPLETLQRLGPDGNFGHAAGTVGAHATAARAMEPSTLARVGAATRAVLRTSTTTSRVGRARIAKVWSYGNTGGGFGATSPHGDIVIRPGLQGKDLIETLKHEGVHSFLSPSRGGRIQSWRAKAGQWWYDNSHLAKYVEEFFAEWAGTGSLRKAVAFPLDPATAFIVDD